VLGDPLSTASASRPAAAPPLAIAFVIVSIARDEKSSGRRSTKTTSS
jgi:hypothetical protein